LSGCYAVKLQRIFPSVRKSYLNNLKIWKTNPSEFERQLVAYLVKREPSFFRWHVSGDIPSQAYWHMMERIAVQFPAIKFLAFTKTAYGSRNKPANLSVVRSIWNHLADSAPAAMPRAYMRDKHNPDPRIPADARPCPGNCSSCGMCWSLKSGKGLMRGESVVFDKH